MRLIRFFLKLLLAALAVGLTFAIIFFLTPAWQQAVVSNLLDEDRQRDWQVNAVELTPFGFEAGNVFILQDGVGAEIDHMAVSGPVWLYPFTREIRIDSGELSGLVLDLTAVQVGNTNTSDWQTFLERVGSDMEFWEERIGLILRKVTETGWQVNAENLAVTGTALMPGNRVIPLQLLIVRADSAAPGEVQVRRLAAQSDQML